MFSKIKHSPNSESLSAFPCNHIVNVTCFLSSAETLTIIYLDNKFLGLLVLSHKTYCQIQHKIYWDL